MRITGGEFRGRTLKVPHGNRVRPTQDRVREALFSMLQNELPGSRFLDLFAGTGSVGIEALSRGAAEVVSVEGNRGVHRLTLENVEKIAGESASIRVTCSDVPHWIQGPGREAAFDIVYADPPYADANGDGLASLASLLAKNGTIADGGLLITEMAIGAPVQALEGWTLLRDRTYGQTRLIVRRKTSSESPSA